jgi:iron complex transport system ATP-binding protein
MSHVSLSHVTLRAGRKVLLNDVSLDIEKGTWCTVIGSNGAGKTSLVESISGLRHLQGGEVLVDGENIASMNERDRAHRIAFVPQHPVVPAGMMVEDYVALGRTAYQNFLRGPNAGDHALVEDVMARLGLDEFRHRDVATLSGGERQRMVLARALAQSTTLIVLDEPTTGLDVRHQLSILELLRKEVRECNLTVIATLHDLSLAGQFADRLLLLEQGSVVLDGESREVIRSERLSQHYGVRLHVIDVDGEDVVVPLRTT